MSGSGFDEKERRLPWPRKGDKLFTSDDSDWWHNACLNYFPSNWGGVFCDSVPNSVEIENDSSK